jgi:hypothetical protein
LPLHLKVSTSTFTFSTYDFSPISPPPASSNSSKSTSTTKLIDLRCSTHYISPTIGCWNMLFMWSSLMTSSHVWLPWMNHVYIKMWHVILLGSMPWSKKWPNSWQWNLVINWSFAQPQTHLNEMGLQIK